MFKFQFSTDSSQPDFTSGFHTENDLQWSPSKEIAVPQELNLKVGSGKEVLKLGSVDILHIKPSKLLNIVSNKNTTVEKSVKFAEKNHSDLIPSKYEGGFKVWECTHDIANYLKESHVSCKVVLDVGCGVGLLGVLMMKLGAHTVHFQDYNEDVLRFSTMPNVLLNSNFEQVSKCKYFSGDWSTLPEVSHNKYDVIVTSETIYNPINYEKLHHLFQKLLKPSGIIVLGAKSYYFGVGGSTHQFEQLVRSKDIFDIKVVWKSSQGVQREILLLQFKTTAT